MRYRGQLESVYYSQASLSAGILSRARVAQSEEVQAVAPIPSSWPGFPA